jgi:hypothetical protein
VPLPDGVPEIIWRQRIDLNPLDPAATTMSGGWSA